MKINIKKLASIFFCGTEACTARAFIQKKICMFKETGAELMMSKMFLSYPGSENSVRNTISVP
jgi:hypothetical protein